jgi:hypothetical protein
VKTGQRSVFVMAPSKDIVSQAAAGFLASGPAAIERGDPMQAFRRRPHPRDAALLLALACAGAHAQQAAQPAPQPPVKLSGGIGWGIGVRTSDPRPDLLFVNNAPAVGLASPNSAGRNQDDGNLNYGKGDVFSHVVKGFADLDLRQGALSGKVRVQAWHDAQLADGSVPWGHTANGFAADAPLSDAGARPRGKFSNAVFGEAWLRREVRVAGAPLTVTFGQQHLGWRGFGLAPGPMAVLDPADFVARARPGAFPEEGSIPIPAVRGTWKSAGGLSLDAFWQFAFRANQTPLCGTFFALADRTLDGCDRTMVNAGAGALSDRALLPTGRFVTLGSVLEPGGADQFGVSARWAPPGAKAEYGLAYARYHSRSAFTNMVKSGIPGANPFAPGDARNPQTQVVYPEGIHLLALEVRRQLDAATLYGSVGYSPNQPLAYPGGEIFQTFVAPVANASLFRAQERATAAGGVFEGWDRRKTSDWQLGVVKPLRNVAGASTLALRAELNARYVHDLPDPAVLRYGRPEVYGIGPINGTCAAGASPVTCTNAGYVSRSAWGYALQAIATYPKAAGPVDLRPRIGLAHNVNGTAWDGTLREGRKTLLLGLDAVYGRTTASLSLVRHNGGTYDNATDRDYVTVSVTSRF